MPASHRGSSVPLRPRPSGGESKKDDLAIAATGFGREVPRAKLEEFSKTVLEGLPLDVKVAATFWSYPFAKYFLLKFERTAQFLTALDYFKVRNAPYLWNDPLEAKETKIFVRRDKTIAQQIAGRFNSHFYQGTQSLLEDTTFATNKLRIFRSKLFIEIEGDIMPLLVFEETTGDEKYTISPKYANFVRLGVQAEAVDAMIAVASATARSR